MLSIERIFVRHTKSETTTDVKPSIGRIRAILGHWGIILFISLLLISQYIRYYTLRTGHCDFDGCLSLDSVDKNASFCSFCKIVWFDQFIIDSDTRVGVRLENLKTFLFILYINLASYLFMSLGSYFMNSYFLIIYLIAQAFCLLVFTIKIMFVFIVESSIITRFILCPSWNCSLLWLVIYAASIYFIVKSAYLLAEFKPLAEFSFAKDLLISLGSIDKHWTTTLTEEKIEGQGTKKEDATEIIGNDQNEVLESPKSDQVLQ
uniref:Uncharacterized protein n=1 Tax=Tetranychus urticae TaxID=32264 RepID=T1KUY2_TETUR